MGDVIVRSECPQHPDLSGPIIAGPDEGKTYCAECEDVVAQPKERVYVALDDVVAWLWSRGSDMGGEVDLFVQTFETPSAPTSKEERTP